jgi:hypothetical protein
MSGAQLPMPYDDAYRARLVWDAVLDEVRLVVATLGTKRAADILSRVEGREINHVRVAQMLAENERHELKAKHLVALLAHAHRDEIVALLAAERGLEVKPRVVLSDRERADRLELALGKLPASVAEALKREVGL